MSNRSVLLRLRVFLLLTVLLSIGAGVLLRQHAHKVAASAGGGVAAGILVSLIVGRVAKYDPKLWNDINKNIAEARELLQPIRSAYGMPSSSSPASARENFKEMLEHPIVILLLFVMAWISWLDPAFSYSDSLNGVPVPQLAKVIGTHFFAFMCMAFAIFGVASALQRRRGNAP